MFPSRRSRCFLFQAQNHRSVRVTTSRNQQRTKEERSVLLYNNRWICLLPFARKPDPRRVSKQVSREPPQAWLFGLVRLAPQAEKRRRPSDKRRRPSQFSAPQAQKYAACCDLPALLARVSPALLAQSSSTSRRSLFSRDRERAKDYCRSVCCAVFLFLRGRRSKQRGRSTPMPPPRRRRRKLPGRPPIALRGRRR